MFGVVMSLAGLEHGIGNLLQGNVPLAGMMFEPWPGFDAFNPMAGEPAVSVIPDLRVSCLLTVLISLTVPTWPLASLATGYGGLIPVSLSLVLLLVGCGVAPPVVGMMVGAAATQINRPVSRRRDPRLGRAIHPCSPNRGPSSLPRQRWDSWHCRRASPTPAGPSNCRIRRDRCVLWAARFRGIVDGGHRRSGVG
jgi:hypothetical protein